MELSNIKNSLHIINNYILNEGLFDFELLNITGNNLTIIGSRTFTYGHSIEVKFLEISFLKLSSEWKFDLERGTFEVYKNENSPSNFNDKQLYKFEIFPAYSTDIFIVICENIEYNFDKVYYFKKENLTTNERIADWVD